MRPGRHNPGNDFLAFHGPEYLREGDWRFVLPQLPGGYALCLGVDRSSVPLVLAESCKIITVVTGQGSAWDLSRRAGVAGYNNIEVFSEGNLRWKTRRYDLVAALHSAKHSGSRLDIAELAGLVGAGGQLYLEVDRPALMLPPGLLRKRLLQSGFSNVSFYWPRLGFTKGEMLLPLDNRRLQRYYLRQLYFGGTMWKEMLRGVLSLLVRVGLFQIALPHYFAVAQRSFGHEQMPAVLRAVVEWQAALGMKDHAPRKWQWIVLNGGLSARSKLVCPCWREGETQPSIVVKYPRSPLYNARLEAEYGALNRLQSYLPPGDTYTPKPFGELTVGGLRVTVETAVAGKPLSSYMRRHKGRYIQTLTAWKPIAAWLATLHRRSARNATRADLDAALFAPLEAAGRELQLSTAEKESLATLQRAAVQLSEQYPLPLVFNHNDAGPPNLMATQHGRFCGIIDWEAGEFGLPATDLIYFLGRYAYLARSEETRHGTSDRLRGFREMFFGGRARIGVGHAGLHPGTARRWLLFYCRRVGVAPAWLPVLFAACWVMHARNEQAQLTEKLAGLDALDAASVEGYFRMQLRFFLENSGKLAITDGEQGGRAL